MRGNVVGDVVDEKDEWIGTKVFFASVTIIVPKAPPVDVVCLSSSNNKKTLLDRSVMDTTLLPRAALLRLTGR